MTIDIQSTTDSKETVVAAMGDLASGKTVEEKPLEEKPLENGEIKPTEGEKPESEETENPEDQEEENEESEELEVKSENENQDKPKKKGGFQKRIDKMNKRLTAAEQEREYWRGEALRTKPAGEQRPVNEAVKPDLSTKPNKNDFETVDAYEDARDEWVKNQAIADFKKHQRDESVKSEIQTKMGKHHDRVTEFKKSHEDFQDDWDDAIKEVGETNLSLTVREVIVNSDLGPELMAELSKDPKEFKRICSLHPLDAAKALGKIEARFSKTSETSKEKKTTKAPAPVTPVRTRGSTSMKSLYDENLSQRDFERLRAEQLKTLRR